MSRTRIRSIGQFAWYDADVGAECLSCGLVRVFCDFEAEKAFRQRRWNSDVEAAAARFRCPCGSRHIHLTPVPIFKRPMPLPVRPAALRPIYSEAARALGRRQHWPGADRSALDGPLAVMAAAIDQRGSIAFQSDALRAAIEALRPYVYQAAMLDEFWQAGVHEEDVLHGRGQLDHPLNGVLRQLGRPTR